MKEFIEKRIDKMEEKVKVISLEIIVTGCKNKPYFQIKYKEVGKEDYNIGYGSYDLNNVFGWKEECFEIVTQLAEEYNNESVKTNADYIRNMTNDELATFLSSIDHITDEGDRIVVFEGEAMHDNIVDIEIWLKEKREPKGE